MFKIVRLAKRINAWLFDGVGNALTSTNSALDVAVQDQFTEIIDFYLHSHDTEGNLLLSPVAVDDTDITLTPGHGAVIGNIIGIKENAVMYQSEIINVVGDVITVSSPSDRAFTTSAGVHIGSNNMNVDGSATTQIFKLSAPIGVKWDIVRILFYIQDNSSMDDSRFGGLTALTNGVVIRLKNGNVKNIFHVHSNGEFAIRAFDTVYTDKAPAGSFGFRVRRTFGGPSKNGVVIRLDGDIDDQLQVLIQDDLTGLENFNCVAQGHVAK